MCACKGTGELLGTAPPPPPPLPSSSVLTSCSGRFPPFFSQKCFALAGWGGTQSRSPSPNVCVRVFLCAHNESVRSITLPLPLSSSLCVRKCALPFPPPPAEREALFLVRIVYRVVAWGFFYLASSEGEMILKHSYAPPIDPPLPSSRVICALFAQRHDLDQCVVVVALFCGSRMQDE